MNSPSDSTTIVLVDDHALVREGVRGILEAQEDMRVVGEAGDSATAVEVAARESPDIVLLDIEIPGGEAVSTVSQIRACSPGTQIIILSIYEGPQLVQDLLAAGVRGYLLKSVHWQELVVAVRAVRADPDRVVLEVSRESIARVRPGSGAGPLSVREREILDLVGQALSNGQIAARLSLTEATVKRHMRNIFVKLGAVSRIDAVNKAAELHLHRPPGRPRPGDPRSAGLPLRVGLVWVPRSTGENSSGEPSFHSPMAPAGHLAVDAAIRLRTARPGSNARGIHNRAMSPLRRPQLPEQRRRIRLPETCVASRRHSAQTVIR